MQTFCWISDIVMGFGIKYVSDAPESLRKLNSIDHFFSL